jgi:tRNA modification GTPase
VENKIDLVSGSPGMTTTAGIAGIRVSAKTGAGIPALRQWLLDAAGWKPHGESLFLARERHLEALKDAGERLSAATHNSQVFELMAEDLRLAQGALGRITGQVTSDDLLGEIFSRFCIGK